MQFFYYLIFLVFQIIQINSIFFLSNSSNSHLYIAVPDQDKSSVVYQDLITANTQEYLPLLFFFLLLLKWTLVTYKDNYYYVTEFLNIRLASMLLFMSFFLSPRISL